MVKQVRDVRGDAITLVTKMTKKQAPLTCHRLVAERVEGLFS